MESTSLHYAIRSLTVQVGNRREISLPLGVISNFGVYRAFPMNEDTFEAFLMAEPVIVRIEGREIRGRLVRVQGFGETHFGVRWLTSTAQEERLIGNLIQSLGSPSPKERRYQRFELRKLSSKHELPHLAEVKNLVGKKRARILNFSFCGLNVEYHCGGASLAEYIGQRVQLVVITTEHKRIEPVSAKIVRIFDEMIIPGKMNRRLGLKFVRFGQVGRRQYLRMISVAEEQYGLSKEKILRTN